MKINGKLTAFKSLAMFCLYTSLVINVYSQVGMNGKPVISGVDERADKLIKTLTLPEKISLLGFESPGVERLNIPKYNWWNEALHGVARAGTATVFPQAIGLSATFNDSLLYQVSTVISTEGRAKFNLAVAQNRRIQYMGLTFWTPNINIFRDPRWGRGQETYGEDPYLTATMATAFVKGLQGTNSRYLKTAACAKHFAVHSGPEAERHGFNAVVDEKDLRETYLYSFKKLVDAGVNSVMCAYNRVNGEPCCTSPSLQQHILRDEWKFTGQMVTDCGALDDIISGHKTFTNGVDLAAAAVKANVNMECGNIMQKDVMEAVNKNLLTKDDINKALKPTLVTALKLGLFDNGATPYNKYGADSVHNTAHINLAREAARQSMVLLKNNGVLPLQPAKCPAILVTGVNSQSLDALVGNYHGLGENMVTFAEGIAKAAGPAVSVQYDQGCDYTDTTHFGGLWVSGNSDATIAVLGLTPVLEGEEGDAFLSASGGDRQTLSIPRAHVKYLQKLRAATKNKPLILVITAGSSINIAELEPYADAIIMAWYPGEQGGNALADIIFGKVSPSGHLPVTFYQSLSDVPTYKDYSMKERTYRYFTGKVQYPFGFGLSYTQFNYAWAQQPKQSFSATDTIRFSVNVQNIGNYNGDAVVQAYIQYPNAERMPVKELKAFKRVSVTKGGVKKATLNIPVSELFKWDLAAGAWKLYPGTYTVNVGDNAEHYLLRAEVNIK